MTRTSRTRILCLSEEQLADAPVTRRVGGHCQRKPARAQRCARRDDDDAVTMRHCEREDRALLVQFCVTRTGVRARDSEEVPDLHRRDRRKNSRPLRGRDLRVSDLLCNCDLIHASEKGSCDDDIEEILDELLEGCERPEDLLGDTGLMKELKIKLMERMLGAELTEHLGYEDGEAAPPSQPNRRNGSSKKIVKGEDGDAALKT